VQTYDRPGLRSRFAKSIAVLAALHLLGGHWVALQSVAWVTMVLDNSQEVSLGEALEKTFDGKHPCPLCKAVAAGQEDEQERQDTLADPNAKLLAMLVGETTAPSPISADFAYLSFEAALRSVSDSSPSPPPKAV